MYNDWIQFESLYNYWVIAYSPSPIKQRQIMGIRFYCPNGHKLNVKSFQAGKMGVCPHCGAKTQIPTESTRPSSAEIKEQSPENVPVQSEMPLSNIPMGTSADAAPPAAPDPLAEAPDAVWYVRLASGDQFGPALSSVMGEWLSEGRIAPDSLVWREGWQDWLKASEVFPQLSDSELTIELASIPTTPISRTASQYRTTQRRNSKKNTSILIALILVLAVLAGILSWVLSKA